MSDLSALIWANWAKWSNGGLDEDSIQRRISEHDLGILLSWIDIGYSKFEMVRPLFEPKVVVDIATWCLYGTHSLLFLPAAMRQERLQEASEHLDVPINVLSWLIGESRFLEAQL